MKLIVISILPFRLQSPYSRLLDEIEDLTDDEHNLLNGLVNRCGDENISAVIHTTLECMVLPDESYEGSVFESFDRQSYEITWAYLGNRGVTPDTLQPQHLASALGYLKYSFAALPFGVYMARAKEKWEVSKRTSISLSMREIHERLYEIKSIVGDSVFEKFLSFLCIQEIGPPISFRRPSAERIESLKKIVRFFSPHNRSSYLANPELFPEQNEILERTGLSVKSAIDPVITRFVAYLQQAEDLISRIDELKSLILRPGIDLDRIKQSILSLFEGFDDDIWKPEDIRHILNALEALLCVTKLNDLCSALDVIKDHISQHARLRAIGNDPASRPKTKF